LILAAVLLWMSRETKRQGSAAAGRNI